MPNTSGMPGIPATSSSFATRFAPTRSRGSRPFSRTASRERFVEALGHAAFDFIESRWGKAGIRQFLLALRRSASGGGDPYEAAFRMPAGGLRARVRELPAGAPARQRRRRRHAARARRPVNGAGRRTDHSDRRPRRRPPGVHRAARAPPRRATSSAGASNAARLGRRMSSARSSPGSESSSPGRPPLRGTCTVS